MEENQRIIPIVKEYQAASSRKIFVLFVVKTFYLGLVKISRMRRSVNLRL